jgi:hypothetical protein
MERMQGHEESEEITRFPPESFADFQNSFQVQALRKVCDSIPKPSKQETSLLITKVEIQRRIASMQSIKNQLPLLSLVELVLFVYWWNEVD